MARKTRDSDTGQLDLFLTGSEPAPAESSAPRLVIDPSPPPNPEPQKPIESDMPPETPIPPDSTFSPADPILPAEPVPDLPPPPDEPPEVAADIRAMFLEEEERQRAEETITIREGKPPLVTGIYRKPRPAAPKPLVLPLADPLRRPATPSADPKSSPTRSQPERPVSSPHQPAPRPVSPPPPPPAETPVAPPDRLAAIRGFFAGAKLGRNGLLALLGSIVLVALLAWWAGFRDRSGPQADVVSLGTSGAPESPVNLPPANLSGTPEMPAPEQQPVLQDSPATAAIVPETPLASTPVPAASGTAGVPATGLRIPGATVTLSGDGAWLVRYDAAVFVSADKISVEGMKALKATAAALLKLADGATITIYGHTDDIPPPPDALGPFRTNADLANARAKVVQDHLTVFCKRQSRYAFEMAAPGTVPAPYPNDTDAHRRLNRTVTLRIVPTGHTAD